MSRAAQLSKLGQRFRALYQKHKKSFWLGTGSAGLLLLIMGGPDGSEKTVIFKRERDLDFKGAEILGNTRQSILQGQETAFAKSQKSFRESEAGLKSDIAALRTEIDQLKARPPGSYLPGGSPTPVPSAGVLTAETYGPQPLPSPPAPKPLTPPAAGVAQSGSTDQLKLSNAAPERSRFFGSQLRPIRPVKLGANMVSFPVKTTGKVYLKKPEVVLPSGSYVKATLLTGVEAPEGKSYPVLLQLDYAYVIPNDKRLDLAGCFMIAKAQGDLSTERVQMQATKLSCVSKRSGMFEREINGFVADDADNSFAVVGSVNSKQDRVAATAFLSSIVAGIGKAIQQAQTTNQTTPLGGSQSVVTGDQAKYIAAGGAAEAASMVTQWYLKQAQNLLPTINVGSGQNVWVIMQEPVDLPKEYFNQNGSGGAQNASIYSYFTRIIE